MKGEGYEGPDIIIRDAGGVFGIIAKDRKPATVMPVQSILGAKPQEAHLVLDNSGNIAAGQAILGADADKGDIGLLRIVRHGQKAYRKKNSQPEN